MLSLLADDSDESFQGKVDVLHHSDDVVLVGSDSVLLDRRTLNNIHHLQYALFDGLVSDDHAQRPSIQVHVDAPDGLVYERVDLQLYVSLVEGDGMRLWLHNVIDEHLQF